MKKLLLFFMSLNFLVSSGQALSEGFEGTTVPDYTLDNWDLGSGQWKVFDNGIGTVQSWREWTVGSLVHSGLRAAYVQREAVGAGLLAEDWLVTPQVLVPADGQLRFYTRKAINTNNGTLYDVRISTVSQTNPADFIVLDDWNDATINSDQFNPVYEQKVIDLSAYPENTPVYIAFVMTNNNGNRWLVDDVFVDSKCLDPTTQWVTAVNDTSVDLNWDNPSGATEWEIEWGPTGFTQGSGTLVTPVNSNPYTLPGLTAATTYDFYVRSVCPNENFSSWVGPYTFSTAICSIADQCEFDFILTDDWGDGWNGNSMTISQLGQTVATITLTNNGSSNGDGPETISVALCSGEPFSVFWNGGDYPEEVAMEIRNPDGILIFDLPIDSDNLVGTTVFSGPASCVPPTCPKPSDIMVSNITTTSGTITWSDNTGSVAVPATQWQVVIQPAGSGYPLNGSEIVNETVFATTYNFSGLDPATSYEVYVLAVCDASNPTPDPSFYEGPEQFNTLPANDECLTALVAPVNDNTSCLNTVHGTVTGATGSSVPSACGGTADDDVWFQFTAIDVIHSISLLNITGSTTDLDFAVYSGSCAGLTEISCIGANSGTVNGLTPGQVYFIRVYTSTSTPNQTVDFDLCIGIPPSCENSYAFCGDAGLIYPNTTGVSSYGAIDCLFTTPNPAWYFMQVSQSGNLNFQIAQTNAAGNGLDVDFVLWGPFTLAEYQSTMCSSLYDFPDGNTTIPDNVVACSYSAAAIENFTVPNAQAGEIYLILITNYSNQTGTVTFNQTGGTGATNCDIVCSLDLGEDQVLCASSYEITATATSADSFQWYLEDVLIPGATASTYTAVESGTYKCVIQCDINEVEDTIEVTLNATTTATFTNLGPLCLNATSPTLPLTSSNGITGTWSLASSPVTTVDTSVSGTFNYVFTPNAASFPCAPQVTMVIEILPACTFNPIASAVNLTSCETTATGDYFNVTGGAIAPATDVFTATQYGTFVQGSNNLVLNGGQLRSSKTTTSNVCSVDMYYRVYEATTTPPAFSSMSLNLIETCSSGTYPVDGGTCNDGDQIWANTSLGLDLTNNSPGNYIVEVYYVLTGDSNSPTDCDGDIVTLNNSNSYYSAQFVIQDSVTFTSQNEECDSDNAYITFSGFNVGDVYSVTYNDDTVPVGPINYTANSSGEILIGGLDAGTYNNFNFVINGCSIQVAGPIVLTNFSPSIIGITNNSDICFGEDASFIVEGTPNFDIDYTINGGIVQTVVLDASGFATITIVSPVAGSVDLALLNIHNSVCNIVVSNTSSVVVNPLPTATISAPSNFTCLGSNASFVITGTPNATVTYSVDGGANQTIVLDASGNYNLDISSSTDVQVTLIDVTNGTTSCFAPISGQVANVAIVDVPEATFVETQPTCSVTTGTIEVTSPLISQLNFPGDLFISEVTDANGGNINYVEIYNATGGDVDLSNYKLKVEANANCEVVLSGILANDDTVVVKAGTGAPIAGVAFDFQIASCTASVNNNDRFLLTNLSDVVIDQWGPSPTDPNLPNGVGYRYARNQTGNILPSATWDPADWTYTDWVSAANDDYSDMGVYTLYAANFEYILSDGTTPVTQATTTFANVAPGTYTLTVHDTATNCYSDPLNITINPVSSNDPVTTFTYTTPVCEGSANQMPDTSIAGFTTGGEFTATPAGLTIDLTTGEIDVVASTPGIYTVTYAVAADAASCLNAGSSTFEFEITAGIQATFNDITLCLGDIVNTSLPTTSLEGFTGTWDAANIDTSVVGSVVYTFTPDAGQCATTGTLDVEIISKDPVTFTSVEVCSGATISFPTTSDEGYVLSGTWSPSTISTSLIGSVDYTFTPDDVCYDVATFTVVTESCTIQKGISPNGDGKNDEFDLSAYNVSKLEIFNRYGRKVYGKSNYIDEWHGQSDGGSELPTGTYYYVIEFNDLPAKTGWIYINREE